MLLFTTDQNFTTSSHDSGRATIEIAAEVSARTGLAGGRQVGVWLPHFNTLTCTKETKMAALILFLFYSVQNLRETKIGNREGIFSGSHKA